MPRLFLIALQALAVVFTGCTSNGGAPGRDAASAAEAPDSLSDTGGARADTALADLIHRVDQDASVSPDALEANQPDASQPDAASARFDSGADSVTDATPGPLALASPTLLMQGSSLIFPASACLPQDHSPAFRWTGAPAGTRSFALTFEDDAIGAVKWVVWDIPPGTTMLPGDLSRTVHPAELPSASQRGSLGRTGYSGPGTSMVRNYEFRIWALDVEKLPETDGKSTVDLSQRLLPLHRLAVSPPLVARGKEGGL